MYHVMRLTFEVWLQHFAERVNDSVRWKIVEVVGFVELLLALLGSGGHLCHAATFCQ